MAQLNSLNKRRNHHSNKNKKMYYRAVKKVVSYFVLSGDQVGLHDRNLIGLGREEKREKEGRVRRVELGKEWHGMAW